MSLERKEWIMVEGLAAVVFSGDKTKTFSFETSRVLYLFIVRDLSRDVFLVCVIK